MKPEKLEKGPMKKAGSCDDDRTADRDRCTLRVVYDPTGAVHECAWKDPGIFGRRSGNLLCVDRSGSLDLQYVYGIFPLRENQAWKCGKTGISPITSGER